MRKNRGRSEEEVMNNGGGYLLDRPVTKKVNGFNTVLNSLEIGHSSMQGYRVNMEDACLAVVMEDLPDHVIVGILDGHAGSGASEYISERLSAIISETSHFKEYVKLDKNKRAESIDLLSIALVQAYVDIDEEFFEYEHMVSLWSRILAIVTSSRTSGAYELTSIFHFVLGWIWYDGSLCYHKSISYHMR